MGSLAASGCNNNSGGGDDRYGDVGTSFGDGDGDDTSGDGDGDDGPKLDMNTDETCMEGVPLPLNCGDGILTEDEACDDGNTQDGDGCSSDCLCVAAGWQCHPPGEPCHQIAICGDGVVVAPEPCDDGNKLDGDGCSATCKLEQGWKCEDEPSMCEPTICGDGIKEGAEACDDGNALPFDGCSSVCQAEPDCTGDGGCTSECGDGLVINEECDDGNNVNGDGCSSACTLEDGFECQEEDSCEMIDGECVLRVPAVFRDFNAGHSDFAVQCDGLQTGGLANMLDGQGKPVPSNTPVCQSAKFSEWYTDNESNATIVSDIVLFDNGVGGFVNRWGPNGEQWTAYENAMWAANTVAECMMQGCVPCPWDANVGCFADEVTYDGQPFFFPIDDHPDALPDPRYEAKVGPSYGYPNWPWEKEIIPGAGNHNFHFTTEVVYWFQYNAATTAQLDFTGDDDVWVFVNRRLAVDLGGVHVPESGSVTINAASAGTYGLTDGEVYQIVVFHAERKQDGSSFRLTLDGFSNTPSNCLGICGDGIVVVGEQCDDGINDGGYGECGPDCLLGGYCGDGIVQDEEDCDDGNYVNADDCPNSCKHIFIP
ncbi:DUF4215 domain-containing protein [Enhygromyxa salina]|nr:DUF4215 domain-containing protein [Enhygromyxa salina]